MTKEENGKYVFWDRGQLPLPFPQVELLPFPEHKGRPASQPASRPLSLTFKDSGGDPISDN